MEVLRHGSQRLQFLDIPFHQVSMEQAVKFVTEAMRSGKRLQHGDVNVAKLVHMKKDQALRRHVEESDLICVDGIGVVLGCRLIGVSVKERVTGIDLMQRTIEVCEREGFRPYFLGAKAAVLEDMIDCLRKRFPALEIAGWRHGYFSQDDEADIVANIRSSGADCLFVGITSPIKERFLNTYRDELNVSLQMGVGGAFDVVSEHTRRAPEFVQRLGMEWLFRLSQEPRRLFLRYLTANVKFAVMLVSHMMQMFLQRLQPSETKP